MRSEKVRVGLRELRRGGALGMGCVALLMLGGCRNEYLPTQVPVVPSEAVAPELYRPALDAGYTIGQGDGLLLQSYYDANLKQQAVVRPDGRVSLLLLGDVMAAGKTPKQFSDELAQLYGKLLDHPDVTVSVTSSAGMEVYVSGEVKSPSQVPIKGELTLLESITEVGGFLPSANKEQVLLLRKTPEGRYRTVQLNVEKVLKNQASELYLQRHDIVYVPKSRIAKVDEYVDQYLNSIIPHAINFGFGYQYVTSSSSGTTSIAPGPAPAAQ